MPIKKLLKNKLTYYFATLAISLFFVGCQNVSAATLSLSANSTTVSAGETVTLYVILNSEGVAVNNAEATIKFPTELFDIVSISKGGSIFSLWVEEPSFSNAAGVVSFNGGSPTPGFTGARGSIISIVAKAKKTGQAEFSFSSAAVRANDGLGTDVLRGKYGDIIVVAAKETPVKETPVKETPVQSTTPETVKETPTEQTTTAPSTSLQITSLTHPSSDEWYKDKNPIFGWNLPKDINAVQTGIGNNNSFSPSVIYTPAISKKAVQNLEDGVWYFKVRARKGTTWGPIATYVAKIDSLAPEKKNVEFSYDDDNKNLTIVADISDAASGLDHYELFLNDSLIKNIPAAEFVGGKYSLDLFALGENNVKLIVFDKAGNSVEALGSFYSTGVSVPPLEPTASQPQPEVIPPQLSPLPTLIAADNQLIIQGSTQEPDIDVTINVKNEDGQLIVFKTRSNYEKNFFALIPNLKVGNYEIWSEISSGDKISSSKHLQVEATPKLITTIGPATFKTLPFIGLLLVAILILMVVAFYFGQRFAKSFSKQKSGLTTIKRNNAKILSFVKSILENNLSLIHTIRHRRMLTKEEKKIKKALEDGLDQVDKWFK
jgi:hypothetical protein